MKRDFAYSIRATFVAMLALSLLACKPKPKDEDKLDPRVKFLSYAESYPEDGGLVSLPVRIYDVDEKDFPVTVTFSIKPYNNVVVDEWIALQDKGNYTVTFEKGSSVAPIYFYMINNDELQTEVPAIEFTLESTSTPAAPLAKPNYTIIRITDDEKAPRVASGQYDARYTLPAEVEATREESGYFPLTIAKTGKYEYVAYGWMGLNRPRLVGTFDPEAKTLTFNGTDYDMSTDDAKVSAFGKAYYYNDLEMKEVLVFRGSGSDGKGAIVLNTDEIGVDEVGYITTAVSTASFDIHVHNADNKLPGEFLGLYDQMPEGAAFKHKTVIDEEKYEEEDMENDPTVNENQEVMSRSLKAIANPAGLIEIAEPFTVVE